MEIWKISILAFAALPIIVLLVDGIIRVVAHARSFWRSRTLRAKLHVFIVFIILITSGVGGIVIISNENHPSGRSPFVVPSNSGPNLLANPSFETGLAGLSDNWKREFDPEATFSIVDIGVVDGDFAQHISIKGSDEDKNGISEIYQATYPYNAYGAGDILVFSVYVSGSITKCSMIIGLEGFDTSDHYIDEKDVYISGLSRTPQIFGVSYQVPTNCSCVAAFIQFNEIFSYSSLSISLDNASLVRTNASHPEGVV